MFRPSAGYNCGISCVRQANGHFPPAQEPWASEPSIDGQLPDSHGVLVPPPWAANVENWRSNFWEPQDGQADLALDELTRASNALPHFWQMYS